MKKGFTLFIFTFILAAAVQVFADGSNLVRNSGFEQVEGADAYFWSKYSWENKGQFIWDSTQKHSGQKSLCIINGAPSDSRIKQQIPVKPNTYYKLSCWMKTENVAANNKGANISIDGLTDMSREVKGTTGSWEHVEMYGKSGPDQQNFTITLGLGGYGSLSSGKAWFDDVSVEELNTAPGQEKVVRLYKDTAPVSDTSAKSSNSTLWIVLGAFLTVFLASFMLFFIKTSKNSRNNRESNNGSTVLPVVSIPKVKLDKQDFMVMGIMTLVYLVAALVNLGSLHVPQTPWKPEKAGESFVIDLGKETQLSRIYYYCGLGDGRDASGKYRIQYPDASGKYQPYATIDKKDLFIWKTVDTPDVKVQNLQILVDSPGGTINELGFFEKGSTEPLKGVKIIEKTAGVGQVENLLDEQDRIDYHHSYLSGMIFDEIYHARTAYEYLHHIEPFEWTHPPFGKILISLGIIIFGMNPFGWRIVGTLFGVAMVPIMYLFGRKLFDKKFYAFCAAFLMMFDFMHFGLTRIATIDVYGTFFVILMYYFMYDYFTRKSYELGFKKSLRPLFWSGLFFGIGAASKWIGVYAGGGLAFLFFLQKYLEYRDYSEVMSKKGKKAAWVNHFVSVYMGGTALYCVLFFVVIPSAIYVLSYIPYFLVPGKNFDVVFHNQRDMFNYHSQGVLGATHPFSSLWWEWPLIRKPLETYAGTDLPAGMSSTMTIMGNPAIWWIGIAAVMTAVFIAIYKRDKKMVVIFAAIAFQYLPWVGVKRIVFIYHFFSTVPFLILAIVYVIKYLLERYPDAKYIVYTYLGIVAVLFVMFYPVLSGLEVSRWYVEHFLLWFKGRWFF